MNANHLLFWLSAKREGSWQQFRTAVEELHLASVTGEEPVEQETSGGLPLYWQLRFDLQRLAHVEFNAADKHWRISPPVLSATKRGDKWTGFLCGARLPELIGRVEAVSNGCVLEHVDQKNAPDLLQFGADDYDSLSQIATKAAIKIQLEPCRAMLAVIPPVDDPQARAECDLPAGEGWDVRRFSASRLVWTQSEPREPSTVQDGLFRFEHRNQYQHLLRWRGRTFSVNGQVGKYLLLRSRRKRKLFLYDNHAESLSVPPICVPPPLIDRALTLCSGKLPEFDRIRKRLLYKNIPRDVAVCATWLLRQEIQ